MYNTFIVVGGALTDTSAPSHLLLHGVVRKSLRQFQL